jgi:uncharacterized protein (TIGR00266 family)
MPVLQIVLDAGEGIVSEAGELSWMTRGIQMKTGTGFGASKKGFLGSVKRAVGGGSFWMTEYTAEKDGAAVAFAVRAPGEIKELVVSDSTQYVVHRHGFICGQHGISLEMFFQKKVGAGIFGQEGFLLQKLTGEGTAFVEMHGDVMEYELAPGQEMLVHPGHISLFESSVEMSLTTIPGIKNKLLGGDGFFLVALKGPGKIWLQSLTLARLAGAIAPYLPSGESSSGGAASIGGAAGLLGGLAGSILDQSDNGN